MVAQIDNAPESEDTEKGCVPNFVQPLERTRSFIELVDLLVEQQQGRETYYAGFCVYPHGGTGVMVFVMTLCAFTTSICSLVSCSFVQVDMTSRTWGIPRDVGFLKYADLDDSTGHAYCRLWMHGDDVSEVYDGTWFAARLFALTATFLGFVTCILILLSHCIYYHRRVFGYLEFTIVCVILLYGLTFVVFGSDVCKSLGCHLGFGGIGMIIGMILWLCAIVFTFPLAPRSAAHNYCLLASIAFTVLIIGLVNGLV
jgi:hypothetical protein